jgi:hypothetical protein
MEPFHLDYDSNWQLWSAIRWNWYQKWWNLRWLIPTADSPDLKKNKILKTVWATNNWSTPLDRARRVVLEKVSRRIRCQLHLLLFDNSCRKCESSWYWPRPRSKKVKALFLWTFLTGIQIHLFYLTDLVNKINDALFYNPTWRWMNL